MNIYLFELKLYIKSMLIWVVSTFGLMMSFMPFYPNFASDAEAMNAVLANYPEELLKAFGMASGLSLTEIGGYYVFVFTFIQLLLAMQSSNYGFAFLSVEERELTADFLMTKPVSRNKILLSKFLAIFTVMTVTNISVWIGTFLTLDWFGDGKAYDHGNMMVLLSSIVLFQLVFMSIGMIVSVLVKKVRSVLSFSMALAFGMYMLNAVASIIGSDVLALVSPFYHFEPGYILKNGAYNMEYASISIIIIVVSCIGTYFLYNRRNIHSL